MALRLKVSAQSQFLKRFERSEAVERLERLERAFLFALDRLFQRQAFQERPFCKLTLRNQDLTQFGSLVAPPVMSAPRSTPMF
jgi:hypothetical protein